MYSRRFGSGPPLVLLHGIGLDHTVWEPVRPLLENEREVIAVDLPGFGESPPLPGTPSVPALADAVEALGLDRPHVAGNSLGGAVAIELGARGAARSVCALSPAGFAVGREDTYARGFLRTTHAFARAVDSVAERVYGGPARRTALLSLIFARPWRVPTAAVAHSTHTTARGAFLETLPAITAWTPRRPVCPTTVAWAQHDRLLLTSRQAPRAQRMLPAARHLILHGCGHVPMWDDPEQLARVMLEASRDA